jgi:hypothetical protein
MPPPIVVPADPWTCFGFSTTDGPRSNDMRGLPIWPHIQLLVVCYFLLDPVSNCCFACLLSLLCRITFRVQYSCTT